MAKAVKAKQLTFSMPNKVGLLLDITCALTDAEINIEAICAYEWDETGYFMLITNNNPKAKRIISKMGAEVEMEDVITVEMPNRVGQLMKAAQKIAEAGIDIQYLYGSPCAGKTVTIVFKTANDRKALRVLAA
ncbi:MAG: ACT domain-containing protein [Syntrophales bacterium]